MDRSRISILIVDDEEKILSRLERILAKEGYRTDTAARGEIAAKKISDASWDIVLTDLNMPDRTGFEIMEHIRDSGSDALPLVLTGYASVESAIRAIKLGAYDFIQKPIDAETLKLVVHRAAERVLLKRENERNMEELRKLNTLKDEFLSVVSHDLRSPLSAIGGYANYLIKKKDFPESHKRYLEIISEIAGNLYSLVNELLDVSKIETGVIQLVKEEADLGDLIDKSIMNFIILASDKSTSIRFHNGLSNPYVRIDRMKILQVVNNLINNAVKFTDSGTITVRARELEDGNIAVSVQDTGVGIKPSHMPRIFDQYTLFHRDGTRGEAGTGLGLVICKRFVELHGGSIRVDSDTGKGSTFEFIIPRGSEQ